MSDLVDLARILEEWDASSGVIRVKVGAYNKHTGDPAGVEAVFPLETLGPDVREAAECVVFVHVLKRIFGGQEQ